MQQNTPAAKEDSKNAIKFRNSRERTTQIYSRFQKDHRTSLTWQSSYVHYVYVLHES